MTTMTTTVISLAWWREVGALNRKTGLLCEGQDGIMMAPGDGPTGTHLDDACSRPVEVVGQPSDAQCVDEVGNVHGRDNGQFVPISQAKNLQDGLGLDNLSSAANNHPMDAGTEFKQAFIARIKACRIATGKSQDEFASLLGTTKDNYAKYESRSLLPHHFVPRFAALTGVTVEYLFTGRGQKPKLVPAAPTTAGRCQDTKTSQG